MAALPGYVYDELPPDPPQLMTEEPIFVAFENIQVQLGAAGARIVPGNRGNRKKRGV